MSGIVKRIRQLFCLHSYEKIGFIDNYDNGVRYPIRKYRCEKCGKELLIDGRYDKYGK